MLVIRIYCAKTTESIEMSSVGLTHVGPGNHVLGQDTTNPFATVRGDKSTMRPIDKILWTLVNFGNRITSLTVIRLYYLWQRKLQLFTSIGNEKKRRAAERSVCHPGEQVSDAADRPARRSTSDPPCCTQMSTVSVINLVTETVTNSPHWPSN